MQIDPTVISQKDQHHMQYLTEVVIMEAEATKDSEASCGVLEVFFVAQEEDQLDNLICAATANSALTKSKTVDTESTMELHYHR